MGEPWNSAAGLSTLRAHESGRVGRESVSAGERNKTGS